MKAEKEEIKKLVCLGDSLTEGYNIDPKQRWTKILCNKLQLPIVNSGISGDLTAGMLARFQRDVVDHEPSHMIIMGGTNDLYFDLPNNMILSNIKAILRQTSYYGIIPIIGLPTSCYKGNDFGSMYLNEDQFVARILEYRALLKNFSDVDKQILIDFDQDMSQELFMKDGVHPNEQGQVVMAKNAFKVLLTL